MSGIVTQKVVERFVPIVKKAIKTTLVQMMASSIQQELAQPAKESQVPEAAPAAPEVSPSTNEIETRKAVETTEEELKIFAAVREICSKAGNKRDIGYADSVNYFAIHVGKSNQWFLRLTSGNRRKALISKLPLDQASALCPGFQVEEAPGTFGVSRVYFDQVTDVAKLEAYVLAAYAAQVLALGDTQMGAVPGAKAGAGSPLSATP